VAQLWSLGISARMALETQFEAQLRWLRQIDDLLEALAGQLTADETAEARHLIEHGEPDIGLNSLAWIIETESKPVPADLRRRIVDLIGDSSEREYLPESFKQYVTP